MAGNTQRALLALLAAPLLLGGCGLEGLLNLHGGTDYTQPVSVIRGSLEGFPDTTRFQAIDVNGEEIPAFASTVADGRYEAQFVATDYTNLRLQAIAGQALFQAFVPTLANEEILEGVDLNAESTAAVMLIEGRISADQVSLPSLAGDLMCVAGKKLDAALEGSAPAGELLAMIDRIVERANKTADTTTFTFQEPKLSATYEVEESALNPDWVARANYDYDGDGVLNQTTEVFDAVYEQAVPLVDLTAPPDPSVVRVLFTVDFNEGKLNGSCGQISRFRWVRDEPGKQMFFVGGIHQTSPVQDTRIDAMLGNRGGWTPNVIKMYDDGTNGDQTAGDNIWSIYFDLPRGLRLGYKYTWGNQGDLWTGTEEWPGNQRILEVEDRNGDGYVYRVDNFGDENSNKDLSNLNTAAGGSLDWDEDINGDGIPEAGEVPVDSAGNFCGPEDGREFVTPTWLPVVTISCEAFVAE